MFSLRFAVIFALFQGLLSLQEDYYWREYTGTIPADAIIGGQDINGKNIYIGQAYVENQGLIVSEIFPGVREVQAPIIGVKKISTYIKILCGSQSNFFWAPANASQLHVQVIDKRPIIGGHEKGGVLFVGRISDEGEVKIGKITSFLTGNALFYYNNKGKEKSVGSYEVLLYNDDNVDVRIRSNK